MPKTMPMKEAAKKILEGAGGPLRSDDITEKALADGLIKTKGQTPKTTMAAQLAVDAKKKGSEFVRTRPGTYGLKGRDRKAQMSQREQARTAPSARPGRVAKLLDQSSAQIVGPEQPRHHESQQTNEPSSRRPS